MADALGLSSRSRPMAKRMGTIRHPSIFFLLSDLGALSATFLGVAELGLGHQEWGRVTLVAMIAWAMAMGHYTRRLPPHTEIGQLGQSAGLTALAQFIALHHSSGQWELVTVAAWSTAMLTAMVAGRWLVRRSLIATGLWQVPTLVVGNGNADRIAAAMNSAKSRGYRTVGLLSADATEDEAAAYIDTLRGETDIRLAVVELETALGESGKRLIRILRARHIDVALAPSFTDLPVLGIQAQHFFSHDVVLLTAPLAFGIEARRGAKRLLDVVASSLLLILIAPVLVLISLAVKADGGPLLFGHLRVGLHGRPFRCWKFRTMVPNAEALLQDVLASDPVRAEEWRETCKLKSDPRVTAIGRMLRRSSLDELPQLLNVLSGQMSLIGPRPVTKGELERYGESRDYYLSVRPGITGLWQVLGRNDSSYSQRVVLDAWYVRNWSLWNDLIILLKTIPVVLRRDGAY